MIEKLLTKKLEYYSTESGLDEINRNKNNKFVICEGFNTPSSYKEIISPKGGLPIIDYWCEIITKPNYVYSTPHSINIKARIALIANAKIATSAINYMMSKKPGEIKTTIEEYNIQSNTRITTIICSICSFEIYTHNSCVAIILYLSKMERNDVIESQEGKNGGTITTTFLK